MLPSSFTQCLEVQIRRGGQFKSRGYIGTESYFGLVYRYEVYLKLHEMGSVRAFDSATTLTVCEGYDVTKQEHYFKKRCSCCGCFHRRCTFRVWQVLLFLFVIAVIIAGLALVIAMFETGKLATKHSAIRETDCPDDTGERISLVLKPVFVA